ncbi:hypothetical protein [Hydrogenophaga sp. BPS33]|uniref:hypothetical protein n=1 Tax=Hydrogenophaga sp. BPS33 TaxID=2651974 RepID=UPI0013202298|nr:hypothetical protein [Hydrogenophaga sp. BPS33]QHE83762.1 hypothetical protein F9K07_02130 [Hydrogenophaga sp. BPS33]
MKPESFAEVQSDPSQTSTRHTLTIQSIPDKFYFLLFGALSARLKATTGVRLEAVVVRAISGGIGLGWSADLKRSSWVSRLASDPWVRAYGRLLDGVGYRSASFSGPLTCLRDWARAHTLWRQLQSQDSERPLSLKIDGIEVGDLLVDSYLRFRPAPRFDARDPFVRRLLVQAVKDVRLGQRYFGRVKPRWYFTSYTSYLEHGIPVRAALQQGASVWSFGNIHVFGKQLSQEDPYASPNYARHRADFERLDNPEVRLAIAREKLEYRLGGGIDAATSYMRQSAYGAACAAVPNGMQGAVVVFLHDFYDSPHVYPDLVFDDFWRWVCFTIEVLRAAEIPFFLKPHPNQIALSGAALERLGQTYPDLQWVPAGVTNMQLADAGMACGVTVYGTVAHELAYLGVPTIGCARHPHHAFDFCRTARNRDEYADMLRSYDQPPASKAEMQRQALAFYYMHNLHGEGDARLLQQAFVEFWRACNTAQMTEASVLQAFQTFTTLPAFGRFITTLEQADTASTSGRTS